MDGALIDCLFRGGCLRRHFLDVDRLEEGGLDEWASEASFFCLVHTLIPCLCFGPREHIGVGRERGAPLVLYLFLLQDPILEESVVNNRNVGDRGQDRLGVNLLKAGAVSLQLENLSRVRFVHLSEQVIHVFVIEIYFLTRSWVITGVGGQSTLDFEILHRRLFLVGNPHLDSFPAVRSLLHLLFDQVEGL